MSFEIKLVQQIEKYELLYNSKLAEHSRKDLVEQSWEEIAYKVGKTVAECKERWRNIRCSFLRSLKSGPKGSRPKKPYYLKEYLNFILPYLKPYITAEKASNYRQLTKIENTALDSELSMHSEDLQNIDDLIENDDAVVEPLRIPRLSDGEESADIFTTSSNERKRKRACTSEVEQSIIKYLDSKTRKIENSSNKEVEKSEHCDAMRYFLLSLLPDVTSMNIEQQRFFKVKVLMLIDEIHSNFERCRSNHSTTFTSEAQPSMESQNELVQ
ncbi:unnamed protein product [Callosobruchus maculatus]|uniref:Uncharacterized protein n=1 Tax=Callosobruchus maculatus TaxID=64391 RepID=A0A653DL71_CALMS|nr:unnamed protein product [Callosobruchus maculatus]